MIVLVVVVVSHQIPQIQTVAMEHKTNINLFTTIYNLCCCCCLLKL